MTDVPYEALAIHSEADPWGGFINARLRVIYWLSQKGHPDEYIADCLSMFDVQQVALIRMTAEDWLAKGLAARAAALGEKGA